MSPDRLRARKELVARALRILRSVHGENRLSELFDKFPARDSETSSIIRAEASDRTWQRDFMAVLYRQGIVSCSQPREKPSLGAAYSLLERGDGAPVNDLLSGCTLPGSKMENLILRSASQSSKNTLTSRPFENLANLKLASQQEPDPEPDPEPEPEPETVTDLVSQEEEEFSEEAESEGETEESSEEESQAEEVIEEEATWEDKVQEYVADKRQVTTTDILVEAIGLDREIVHNAHRARIGGILRELGWVNKGNRKMPGGGSQRMWERLNSDGLVFVEEEDDEAPHTQQVPLPIPMPMLGGTGDLVNAIKMMQELLTQSGEIQLRVVENIVFIKDRGDQIFEQISDLSRRVQALEERSESTIDIQAIMDAVQIAVPSVSSIRIEVAQAVESAIKQQEVNKLGQVMTSLHKLTGEMRRIQSMVANNADLDPALLLDVGDIDD